MRLAAPLRAIAAALALAGLVPASPGQAPASEGWRPFTATWTLSGTRELIATESGRPAAIVHVSGPLTITKGEELGRGFLGEVIGFDDGGSLLIGRAVLTEERGDRIFCALKAEPLGTGRRATAAITGGTGRFAGLQGSFSFAWQYLVSEESGEISLRAINVEGRTRSGPTASPGGGR